MNHREIIQVVKICLRTYDQKASQVASVSEVESRAPNQLIPASV